MPGRGVKLEEVAAGEIVAGRLGGKATPHDVPGAPDASYDVDIMADGRRIALEVTSAAVPELVSMRAAAGKGMDAPSLTSHWLVSYHGGSPVQIKGMLKGLEGHLKVLEDHGVTEVSEYSPATGPVPRAVAEATRQILGGRINTVRSLALPPGETAQLMLTSHWGFISDAEQVNPLVEQAARDNVEKLCTADADDRHLFVWVDEDKAELAMFTQGPPVSTPALPEGIDVVWAATRPTVDGALFERLWRLQPPGGWEVIS
jgi:hypothetical protein